MLRYATYTPRKAHGSAVFSLPNRLIITPPRQICIYTLYADRLGVAMPFVRSAIPGTVSWCGRSL